MLEVLEGELTIDNPVKTGILSQTGGKTIIANDFDLNNDADFINGGELVIENGVLTISKGSIGDATDIDLNSNSEISITGTNSTVAINKDDIWNGKITVADGTLNIGDVGNKAGNLIQNGGNVNVNKNFDLNNTADKINAGKLTIKDNSTLTVSKGEIDVNSEMDIQSGSTLNIAGGKATLNDETWNGNVSMSAGELILAQAKETTANSKYNQTGGTLDLQANLTLKEGSSITGDSIVKLTNSEIAFNNNTSNRASITTDDLSIVSVGLGSNLTLAGGTITDNAILYAIGDVAIDGADVKIGADDVWSGNLSIASGDLTLGVDKVTSTTSKYTQTGGNLSITGNKLTLNEGSAITGGNIALDGATITSNSNSEIKNTNVSMQNASTIEFNNGKTNSMKLEMDDSANTINIAEGSGFNVIGGEIKKETLLGIDGALGILGDSTVTVDNTDTWNGKISLVDGTLILDNVASAGQFEAQSGTLKILGSNTSLKDGLTVNKGVTTIVDGSSTLSIDGGSVTFDANTNSSDQWNGSIALSKGALSLTDGFKHDTQNGTFVQTGGTLALANGAELSLSDALSTITGASVLNLGDKGRLTIANNAENQAVIKTSGASALNIAEGSTLSTLAGSNISTPTTVSLTRGANLNVNAGKVAMSGIGNSSLEGADNWQGKISLGNDGQLDLVDSKTSIGGENGISTEMFEQTGGTLSLRNTVLALHNNTNDILKSGKVTIDSYSRLDLASAWANNDITLQSAGLISSANNVVEANSLGGLIIDNVNGRADFTIDIFEDVAIDKYSTDTFKFASITSTDNNSPAIVNISDWNLNSTADGLVVTSKSVDLGQIFDAEEIGPNVKFTSTAEEFVTPVSRYKLVADDKNDGSYFLNITGYNKQSYRGQVVSVSQMMNQLVINDILFDRMLLTPQTLVPTNYANRSAYVGQAGVPAYTYSRRDPSLWVKTYGNFERLRMTEDLKVHNNAYGSLVGMDLGTFEMSKGWNWVPTLYMGYNGAHQSYSGVSAYENGGQIGAMGTFFNKDWITSVLGYAGIYNMEMSLRGTTDNDFNYYAGTAVKSAYNWRIKDHFIIQPQATVSYNFFGGPKWQSAYGQIGMSTGTLNGLNVAPGVNFILQHDTWSLFATVAYVYNCVGAVGGSAAGIDLPDIWLKRGYLQYGFGASKEITDRFSAYAQVILRNVGRTGIGFQGELMYRF